MKIIIVAAGMGSRLRPYTVDRPKCMVPVLGKPLLEYQLEAITAAGVDNIVLVRGFQADKIAYPGIRYYLNPRFEANNMLQSLFFADEEIDGEFLFSFADILYSPDVIRAALAHRGDAALVVDRDWKKNYIGRQLHPVSEANLVCTNKKGEVIRVGRDNQIPENEAFGEFIGIARFSNKGAQTLKSVFHEMKNYYLEHPHEPFHNSKTFEKAYFDDLIQELVNRRFVVDTIPISGSWMEIDTVEDLRNAERRIESGAFL